MNNGQAATAGAELMIMLISTMDLDTEKRAPALTAWQASLDMTQVEDILDQLKQLIDCTRMIETLIMLRMLELKPELIRTLFKEESLS